MALCFECEKQSKLIFHSNCTYERLDSSLDLRGQITSSMYFLVYRKLYCALYSQGFGLLPLVYWFKLYIEKHEWNFQVTHLTAVLITLQSNQPTYQLG